jgi:hypothetical protein
VVRQVRMLANRPVVDGFPDKDQPA